MAVVAAATLLVGGCSDIRAFFADTGRQPVAVASRDSAAAAPPRLINQPPGTTAAGPLVGLGSSAVIAALGPAGFVRRDGPAEIWRYNTQQCFLDVFLYRESDGPRVNYVAARSRIANRTVTAEACYGAILAERRGVPVG